MIFEYNRVILGAHVCETAEERDFGWRDERLTFILTLLSHNNEILYMSNLDIKLSDLSREDFESSFESALNNQNIKEREWFWLIKK